MPWVALVQEINGMLPVWYKVIDFHSADLLSVIVLNKNQSIFTQLHLEFLPWCSTENKSALVQIMALWTTGDKALPVAPFTNMDK